MVSGKCRAHAQLPRLYMVSFVVLLLALCIGLMPAAAFASGDTEDSVSTELQQAEQSSIEIQELSDVGSDIAGLQVSTDLEVELVQTNAAAQTGVLAEISMISEAALQPPVAEEPSAEAPVAEEPSAEAPVAEEPAAQMPTAVEAELGAEVFVTEESPVFTEDPALDEQAAGDIILGVYFNSAKDWTNSIFASTDGQVYKRISTAFRQKRASDHGYQDANGGWHYPQHTPSIVYYNNKFWILSGWNRQDGKFWPMISYSTDLKHWTHPEGDMLIDGTRGISLDALPVVNGSAYKNFDIVAPEWYISKNGGLYIIVSCGYYGDYHGRPAQDQMTSYIIKVNELSADDGRADGTTGYLWPVNLKFRAQTAKRLPFTVANDYIDGAAYNNGDYDYLVIKKDGLFNQIYRTSNIDNPSAWQLVNAQATYGYEGASIAKLKDTYLMMTDKVEGVTATGVKLFKTSSIATKSRWSGPSEAVFLSENNQLLAAPRHGSLLTLKAGTKEWQVAKALLDNNPVKGKPMYRMYNPNSGEHFYTAAIAERDMLIAVGWHYEGIGWFAPNSSKSPVYRLYNPNAGDHHYTMSAGERDMLKSVGWRYEGIGWYSDDNRSVPLYRQYNPNARTGTHNYTTNRAENDMLIRIGWRGEGIGWYGL